MDPVADITWTVVFTSMLVCAVVGNLIVFWIVLGKLFTIFVTRLHNCRCRPVVHGCAGCAKAHPDFGRSVNPISTRGTDYAHLITTGTPRFSDLPTALRCTGKSLSEAVIFASTNPQYDDRLIVH